MRPPGGVAIACADRRHGGFTGRFVDAFSEAQALDTVTEPPGAHCARFASAVDHAWRCWRAARDAAERIRLSAIPAEERTIVRRAIKLLTMVRESNHDTERAAAYAKARMELAKLERSGTLALPPAAAAAQCCHPRPATLGSRSGLTPGPLMHAKHGL